MVGGEPVAAPFVEQALDRAPSTGRAQCAAVLVSRGLVVSPSLEVVRSHSIGSAPAAAALRLFVAGVCTAGRPRHAGGDRPLSQLPPRPRRGGKLGTHLCPAVVLVRRGELLRSDEHLRPGAAKSPPLVSPPALDALCRRVGALDVAV